MSLSSKRIFTLFAAASAFAVTVWRGRNVGKYAAVEVSCVDNVVKAKIVSGGMMLILK